jgi:hypothetical protein
MKLHGHYEKIPRSRSSYCCVVQALARAAPRRPHSPAALPPGGTGSARHTVALQSRAVQSNGCAVPMPGTLPAANHAFMAASKEQPPNRSPMESPSDTYRNRRSAASELSSVLDSGRSWGPKTTGARRRRVYLPCKKSRPAHPRISLFLRSSGVPPFSIRRGASRDLRGSDCEAGDFRGECHHPVHYRSEVRTNLAWTVVISKPHVRAATAMRAFLSHDAPSRRPSRLMKKPRRYPF